MSIKRVRGFFNIGLWMIPYTMAVSSLIFIAATVMGLGAQAWQRGQLIIVILGFIVVLVMGIAGNGWSASQATKRVRS